MADAQLELPWQLDPKSVRALALGINGNPFAALGPHDTRAGRIIRAFLPGASKVEVLRRSDGTVLAPLEPTDERAACLKTLSGKQHLICSGSIGRRRSRKPKTHTLSGCSSARSIFSYSTKAGISSWPNALARRA